MGMLSQGNKVRIALLLFVAALLLALVSCRSILESFRHTDQTTTVITERDTVWTTQADSATMRIVSDVQALRRLIEQLRADGPMRVRGSRNAELVMSVVNDSLVLDARCDTMALRLENALRTVETTRVSNTELERTVKALQNENKGVVPGWMKGTVYIILAALCALLAIYLLINKTLFKRG